ncbi:hypothetical protein EMIT0111MI5_80177 [Burkholderia sp. IT-111MI5]
MRRRHARGRACRGALTNPANGDRRDTHRRRPGPEPVRHRIARDDSVARGDPARRAAGRLRRVSRGRRMRDVAGVAARAGRAARARRLTRDPRQATDSTRTSRRATQTGCAAHPA